jgi:hypothetical protein
LLLFISCTPSKQIGQLYSREEANKIYGNVILSLDVERALVPELIKKTENTIMFGIINQQVVILDNNRKLIYPEKAEYKDSDVFTVYSVSMLRELISKPNPDYINVEQRREVLSVSYNQQTLETGIKCPPNCPDKDE